MSTGSGSSSPVERAVDLLFHLPLGVLALARDEVPKLVAKGRQEAGGARFIGKMAIELGQREAGKRARVAAEWLSDRGLVPDPRRFGGRSPAAPAPSPAPEAEPAPSAPAPEPSPAPEAEPAASPSLAIPGYDALSASQVVQRLDGLSADELEAVRAYEAANRGRKTILSRVAQLQPGS